MFKKNTKKQTFRVYEPSSLWKKTVVHSTSHYQLDNTNYRSIYVCIGWEIRITAFHFFLALILATWVNLWEWTTHCWLLPMAQSAGWRLLSSRVPANSVSAIFRSTSSSAGSSLRPGLTVTALCALCQKKLKSYRTILVNYILRIKDWLSNS